MKRVFLFLFLTTSCFGSESIEQKIGELMERLHKDDYHIEYFADPRFKVYENTNKLATTLNTMNYFSAKFGYFTELSFKQSFDFLEKYQPVLEKANKKYGVEPEYITAILQIESNFGRKTGNRIVFNSLASMYVYNRKWMYSEIKQYISLKGILYEDPFELKGSYAGAFGIAQALPSSYKKFGVDFNGDGKVDPYDTEDAIGFVANYLNKCGFATSQKNKKNAIFSYNRQTNYVNAIIEYSAELKRRQKEMHQATKE